MFDDAPPARGLAQVAEGKWPVGPSSCPAHLRSQATGTLGKGFPGNDIAPGARLGRVPSKLPR